MSGEETELSVQLSPEVSTWLDDVADGRDPEDAVRDLLVAYRSVSTDGEDPVDTGELADRLDSQREEYRDLVDDVRDRVIQVKRETDRKASQDHDHPDLVEALAKTDDRLDDVEAEVRSLQSTVEDLEREFESGFENYEDVLEYLTDTTDAMEANVDVLARAVLDLRETTREVAAGESARSEATRLKRAANQLGIRSADCEDCDGNVDVGLLSTPECPHCKATFTDLKQGSGFFGSNTLVTGDAPAIEGRVGADDGHLTDIVDEERDGDDEPQRGRR